MRAMHGSTGDDQRARYLIEPGELARRLGEPSLAVLDAHVDLPAPRFDGDYRAQSGQAGWLAQRIPGSVHADLVGALSDPHAQLSFMRPSARTLARELGSLGVGADSDVVIYDRAEGFWAARLWWMLRWIGVNARVLDGGWRVWQAEGLPVETGEPGEVRRARVVARERDGLWADREDVEAVTAGQVARTLVCALSEPVFSGRAASRYARRGHIPGSLNVPARDLFDATGRYRPIAELHARFASLDQTVPVCVYCGGGISAAVDALALTLIGRDDVSIYDGSLQEWAADPQLAMEGEA
ncbi:sulfurtransferase [Paraburkholderia sp. BR10882]|uniref:sulfurtransferase n=1 Tax=unclassified Paraburkholderia TaxID=2615204 RepID=UPI0034CEDFC0